MPYPTASDLASFLKQDLDTATANLALSTQIQLFETRAHSHWGGTLTTTYDKPGNGCAEIVLPYYPVVSISNVQVIRNGVTTVYTAGVDYTLIEQSLYRRYGWGNWAAFPPDEVQITYAYGFPTVTADVFGAILDSSGAMYMNPDTSTVSELIDDYQVRFAANTGGARLSQMAMDLADWYHGALVG